MNRWMSSLENEGAAGAATLWGIVSGTYRVGCVNVEQLHRVQWRRLAQSLYPDQTTGNSVC